MSILTSKNNQFYVILHSVSNYYSLPAPAHMVKYGYPWGLGYFQFLPWKSIGGGKIA
jgi:hypothetical protein